ncbi:flagellar assembly peptidoglycan hydrolase FlgJ [Parashewanella curva]|uniref:Peptidoglycan hydrolase FlgJ n=1 Tax=Parashewanella curva TaxID=2338552 RepID=A0A3L8Q1N7_9GAMM|nr:flagellar assembly peptidoglycan hydrolase FlgJ [Parashewanella curva]RLV61566.1 flagellar assembly peptidoglycan hydrolase FlgJ [Parashewanella curva]
MDKLSNASNMLELGGLDNLRSRAQQNDKGAIKEVAKQFEGIFVQMLMKSMRDANEVFKSDSPFNTQYTAFYEQMRDQQMANDISDKGVLGLADLMVQQLSPETSNMRPASTLRTDSLPIASQNNTAATPKPQQLNEIISGKVLPSQPFESQDDFVKQLYPHAKEAAEKLGTTPEVLIAQSALETGWGKKMVRQSDGTVSNNLFNIKADKRWGGDKARVSTLEFDGGVANRQQADFRVYDSIKQSFDDFVNFLSSNQRYQQALDVAKDPQQFITGLQNAGYATDPNYAKKVLAVMKGIVTP